MTSDGIQPQFDGPTGDDAPTISRPGPIFDARQYDVMTSPDDIALYVGHTCGWEAMLPSNATLAMIGALAVTHHNTTHRTDPDA